MASSVFQFQNMEFEQAMELVMAELNMPFTLKAEQTEALRSLYRGDNTVVVLPTGFGKSIVFALFPLLIDKRDATRRHVAIVVSPLRSLMLDLESSLCSAGIQCMAVFPHSEMSAEKITAMASGSCSVLLFSPELLNEKIWRSNLTGEGYKHLICLFAVDESHCISKWGEDFRPDFKNVLKLRGLFACPTLLLTATVSPSLFDDILDAARLSRKKVNIVATVPDRPNIYLNVIMNCKRSDFLEKLKPYLDEVRESGVNSEKAIIYFKTLSECSTGMAEVMDYVGKQAWTDQDFSVGSRLINMYTSATGDESQRFVVSEFTKPDSSLRVIGATIGFGMGVSVPDVRHIFHNGMANSLLAYWQEIGRCGRDGCPAEATLCLTSRPGRQHFDAETATLLKDLRSNNVSCFRLYILKSLVIDEMDTSRIEELASRTPCNKTCEHCTCSHCQCCSICRQNCPCS